MTNHGEFAAYRYQVTEAPGQWLVLIAPGETLDEVRAVLLRHWGNRLVVVEPLGCACSCDCTRAP